jgi:hypothetical protein
MFRKLIALGLIGGAVAALLKRRGGAESYEASPSPSATAVPEDLAEVRSGQTEKTMVSPSPGVDEGETAVVPDTSDDDPLVRQQEAAAAADAASIGGEPDTVTTEVDPEMRPVVEGSGDAPETLETLEEDGR